MIKLFLLALPITIHLAYQIYNTEIFDNRFISEKYIKSGVYVGECNIFEIVIDSEGKEDILENSFNVTWFINITSDINIRETSHHTTIINKDGQARFTSKGKFNQTYDKCVINSLFNFEWWIDRLETMITYRYTKFHANFGVWRNYRWIYNFISQDSVFFAFFGYEELDSYMFHGYGLFTNDEIYRMTIGDEIIKVYDDYSRPGYYAKDHVTERCSYKLSNEENEIKKIIVPSGCKKTF